MGFWGIVAGLALIFISWIATFASRLPFIENFIPDWLTLGIIMPIGFGLVVYGLTKNMKYTLIIIIVSAVLVMISGIRLI